MRLAGEGVFQHPVLSSRCELSNIQYPASIISALL